MLTQRRTLHWGSPLALTALCSILAAPTAASADVNDFDYSSWDATFSLSLTEDGRAHLTVVETLVADFPMFDQNRGIVRGFLQEFESTSLNTDVLSVTDANGTPVTFWTESDDYLYVLTGDDTFVHGPTTYVITYEMDDVMVETVGAIDEFYWDLLPLDNTQDITAFSAKITVDAELAANLLEESACYAGAAGSTDSCDLTRTEQPDGSVTFAVKATDIAAGEGRTVALGFELGSVTHPPGRSLPVDTAAAVGASDPRSRFVTEYDVLPFAFGGGGLIAGVIANLLPGFLASRSRRPRGTVIARYSVPDDLSPMLAAPLLGKNKLALTAGILSLAVNGHVSLSEAGKTGKSMMITDTRTEPNDMLEEQLKDVLFGEDRHRSKIRIPRRKAQFAHELTTLRERLNPAAMTAGLVVELHQPAVRILALLTAAALILGGGFAIGAATAGRGPAPLIIIGIIMLGLFVWYSLRPRQLQPTERGREAIIHLEGVREFIRVAEADRIHMLQSFTGAERVDTNNAADTLVLYEKLLPYAVLFGQEKQWGDVLKTLYVSTDTSPSWSPGLNSGMLSYHLSQLSESTAASAAYVPPSTSSGGSSSSGGSLGGGFSGGGGGGGFSGGR